MSKGKPKARGKEKGEAGKEKSREAMPAVKKTQAPKPTSLDNHVTPSKHATLYPKCGDKLGMVAHAYNTALA